MKRKCNPSCVRRAATLIEVLAGLVVLGTLLALSGAAGSVWLVSEWIAGGLGRFDQLRLVIFFSLWFFLGVQIVFSSFFISMLGISRGTYIGDYDIKKR